MVPLAEMIVSACLVVAIFIFGLLIDMEAQRRLVEVRAQQQLVTSGFETNNSASSSQWPAPLLNPRDQPCHADKQDSYVAGVSTTTLTSPGSLYFRSICETGSDAPSLTLKAKSISCRLWQQLEAYLESQLTPTQQRRQKRHHAACVSRNPTSDAKNLPASLF
ncbi:Aste57867_2630 [Aphanomyces stellatus]|uniref:Aste57867_2630 protein n=1 Tax=Aphanomyces stellatus TaxID=120398 RepID=A0A485K813_9STRA|nr:hypothetical protein As57867_002623 [Aphanomyces stellatus]VFT79826.1 Aste57867_2630 [Aphanomyces stellatus]